jgi:hypothetical protein
VYIVGNDSIGYSEKKKGRISMCLILNGYRDRAVCVSGPNSVRFFLCGWMKSEVCKRKVETPDELLARILDAAGCM